MKINELRNRENFDDIFAETLAQFLHSQTQLSHDVLWLSKRNRNFVKPNMDILICNSQINSVFLKNYDDIIFSSIRNEYGLTPDWNVKAVAKRLYTYLSTRKPFASLICRQRVAVTKNPIMHSKTIILGGNNKIRLIDCKLNVCYVIIKSGFASACMEREIHVKQNYPDLPVPRLLSLNRENSWYIEEYISGTPVSNLSSTARRECLEAISLDLSKARDQSVLYVNLSEYLEDLRKKLKFYLHGGDLNYDVNDRNDWIQVINKLIELIKENGDTQIRLAFTHGDLHESNLISTSDRCYIIDWENSGIRSNTYDLVMLLLGRRSNQTFYERVINILRDNISEEKSQLTYFWSSTEWLNQNKRIVYIQVFLLEDLLFYFEEYSNPLLKSGKLELREKLRAYKAIVQECYK